MVYAGNMGVAQSMDMILDLATDMQDRSDVGFLFVGRGSDAETLAQTAKERGLNNTVFFDEIDPDSIPDLYQQCFGGIVSLDHRHKSHNIPGKFLTYMQSGLPVFAKINPGNDLAKMIANHDVGVSCSSQSIQALRQQLELFLARFETDQAHPARCVNLYAQEFSSEICAQKIVQALQCRGRFR